MLTDVEGPDAITPRALVLSAGGGAAVAQVLTLVVGGGGSRPRAMTCIAAARTCASSR